MNSRLIYLIPVIIFISLHSVYGQFDKKITFNAFLGVFKPLGSKINPDSIPYVFPNFTKGGQIGVGGQYNIKPNFSVGLNLIYSISIKYKDPIPLSSSVSSNVKSGDYKSSFSITSIGIDSRYKLFPHSKFNPYVFGEVNFNLYSAKVEPHYSYINQTQPSFNQYDPGIANKYTLARFNARQVTTTAALGVLGGIGFDMKLSNTFVLFAQSAYNLKFTSGNNIIQKNLNFINVQAGLRFSLFKSKSLL